MKFNITPTFEDLFDETPSTIEELLFDVPLDIIVMLVSYINGHLFSNRSELDKQKQLFEFIIARFDLSIQNKLRYNISKIYDKQDSETGFSIFTIKYGLDFVQYLLKNGHPNFHSKDDTTPEQELRIFKAYLLVSSKHSKDIEIRGNNLIVTNDDEFHFQKRTWHIILSQNSFNGNVQDYIMFEMFKSISFLKYFAEDIRYTTFIDTFLRYYSIPTIYTYPIYLANCAKVCLNNDKKTFVLYVNEKSPILDNLSFNNFPIPSVESEYFDYKLFKSKPLYKHSETEYLVLDWSFFSNQIYNGSVFDFYTKSGINSIFKDFGAYKSSFGQTASEEIFKNLLATTLNPSRFDVLHFDITTKNGVGIPDVYFRRGKYIFLIEFKDTIMPKEVPEIGTFEKFRAEIDRKFATKKGKDNKQNKGIYQIINQIKYLQNSNYPFDDFELKGLKRKNLVLFPIIVYTDSMYNISGVGDYLSKLFEKSLQESLSQGIFQKIHPLTFINWSFFFKMGELLNDKEIKLGDWISEYHKQRLHGEENLNYKYTHEKLFKIYSNFDEYISNYTNTFLNKKRRKFQYYIGKLFQEIGLTK